MQHYYLERELADMFKTVLSGNQLKDAATADELNKLYATDVNKYKAADYRNKAMIGDMRLEKMQNLGDAMLQSGLLPDGINPQATANMFIAGGDYNPDQLMGAIRSMKESGYVDDALGMYENNPDLANFHLRAGGKTPYTPYSVNEKGAVINQATGEIDTDNPLADASLGLLMAQEAEKNALANKAKFITPGNNSVAYIGDGEGQANMVINPTFNPNVSGQSGQGVPSAPTQNDIKQVKDYIMKNPELSGLGNVDDFALAVASRAREIMKSEKTGLFNAVNMAIEELKQQIQPGEKRTGVFGWDWTGMDTKPTFTPGQHTNSMEGRTATNPQTGEKIIFRGGQWVPLQ